MSDLFRVYALAGKQAPDFSRMSAKQLRKMHRSLGLTVGKR